MTEPITDPVLIRREQIRRVVGLGQRIGYLLFGVALVAFLIGMFTDFPSTTSTVIVAALVLGSIILAPSIVFHYAVRAADEQDQEQGR